MHGNVPQPHGKVGGGVGSWFWMKAGERAVGVDVQPVETKPQGRARGAARQVIVCDEWPGSFMFCVMLPSVSSRMSPNTVSAGRR